MKFAVQLYSVRDHMERGEDFLDVIKKVKEIGFDGVEFAGYFGHSAEELKECCDSLGLEVVGTHIAIENYLPENLQETLRFHETLGCKYIGVGGADHDTYEECITTGKILGDAGKEARKLGMDTYYHNHTEEFTPIKDGATAEDIIGSYCKLELDTYWSFCSGIDNYEYLTKNKDKIVLVHIKDGIARKPKALGEGECDLKKVVDGVKAIGLDWVVLENDNPTPTGLEDIKRSYAWLKSNF